MKRTLLLAAIVGVAPAAQAEIAVLANGQTFKVSSHRAEGSLVWLALKGGGEIALPAAEIRGYVPDEVMDAVSGATDRAELERLAAETARRHGLDPGLVLAVASVESALMPRAVSPKGAQGLMQLMPRTGRALGMSDPFDPAENLDAGTRHLRALLARYGGDLTRALAAYNAGEGAVDRYGGVPPYRETRLYVQKVLSRYQREP